MCHTPNKGDEICMKRVLTASIKRWLKIKRGGGYLYAVRGREQDAYSSMQ